MIVCEVGNIPPHSVPVVIREIFADSLDEEEDILGESDSISSEDASFDSNNIIEKEQEEEDEEEA
jgi:hypothetical protein